MTDGRIGGLIMEWYYSESMIEPAETDTESSQIYNYVRRNIRTETNEEEGQTVTKYVYEECKVPKESWGMYLELIQAQADIDYLNMITEDL